MTFRLIRREGDPIHTLHFRQYHRDLPVYGGWLQMVIEERESAFVIRHLAGHYTPDLDLTRSTEYMPAQKALYRVLGQERLNELSELELLVPPKLWLFDPALIAPRCPTCDSVQHDPRPAWRVILFSP